jgi:hypothetical protein
VHDGIDAAQRCRERRHVEQITFDELYFMEIGRPCRIAHEPANVVAARGKPPGESTTDLAGRTSDEDLHAGTVATHAPHALEEPDIRRSGVDAAGRMRNGYADLRD